MKEKIGIVWWHDACETPNIGDMKKFCELPLVVTAGRIREYPELVEIIHTEHLDPGFVKQNTSTKIAKTWIKKKKILGEIEIN